MARAVMRLWPGIQLAFGPTLPYGFYYDFGLEHTISEDDFPKIEEEMKKIIKEEEPFERFSLDRDEAVSFVNEMDQHSKAEHIQTGLADHGKLSFYRQGEFVDLCRGPHIPNASNCFPSPGRTGKGTRGINRCSVCMGLPGSTRKI